MQAMAPPHLAAHCRQRATGRHAARLDELSKPLIGRINGAAMAAAPA